MSHSPYRFVWSLLGLAPAPDHTNREENVRLRLIARLPEALLASIVDSYRARARGAIMLEVLLAVENDLDVSRQLECRVRAKVSTTAGAFERLLSDRLRKSPGASYAECLEAVEDELLRDWRTQ